MTTVEQHLYTPLSPYRAARKVTACAYAVHERGRSVSVVQCQRPVTTMLEGYGFCGHHAAQLTTETPIHPPTTRSAA